MVFVSNEYIFIYPINIYLFNKYLLRTIQTINILFNLIFFFSVTTRSISARANLVQSFDTFLLKCIYLNIYPRVLHTYMYVTICISPSYIYVVYLKSYRIFFSICYLRFYYLLKQCEMISMKLNFSNSIKLRSFALYNSFIMSLKIKIF